MQVSTAAYGLVTGRVSSVAIDPADTTGNTVYLGSTGGGVWKSSNAAGPSASVSFAPLSDALGALSLNAGSAGQASISIGAVTVQPGSTGVLLAGTGDPNDATDSYYGVGVLRSADNGVTWSLQTLSQDGVGGDHSFAGEGFAGFAWSGTTANLVVAAVSNSAEGTIVNASASGASARGLYYSTDAGTTWKMATLKDGGAIVQSGQSDFSGYEGNAATAVVWNPLRQRFYAAVRYHGYYESADGVTWTRMANQPGIGLSIANCPARAGTTGLLSCPIFRGALAVQPFSGDLFALTVDGANGDVGLYQDLCATNGSTCASSTVLWAAKIPSAPMDDSAGTIAQGDYNLTLAAVPAATALSTTDTLLFAGTSEIFRCRLSDGCSFRNTTNATTGCAAPAKVTPAQHAIAWQANSTNSAAPLLFFGNDGGLWRSTDGVNQAGTSCSADDATHFDNLNGGLGSLAEVSGLSTHPTDGGIALVALGALGSAAATASSSIATFQNVWTQMGTGESGSVAIDQANPADWLVQNGFGVSLQLCNKGAACTPSDYTGPPAIGTSQVNGDAELTDAPSLLDPALNSNVLVGTCRVYRGPTGGGAAWSAGSAISAPLAGPSGGSCTAANGLIRSLAAGGAAKLTGAASTSGSPVLYAGLAGTADGGSNAYGGHFYRTTAGNLANGATVWTDATSGTVTNDQTHVGRFNPYNFDVSSISVDPHDSTGLTVYATVQGFHSPKIYRSIDGAASWLSVTANLPDAPANAVVVDPNDSRIVYVALDTGVYVTTDMTTCAASNAQCWSAFGTALPGAPVTTLVASVAFAVPGSTDNGVLRAGTYGRGIWQIPLLTAGAAQLPTIGFSPAALSFPATAVGNTSTSQNVTVANSGNAPLVISQVSASMQFLESDNCAGQTLAPGQQCSAQVSFAPTAAGMQTGALQVSGNVLGGYASLALGGTASGTAAVQISPASYTFTDVPVQSSGTPHTFLVTNNGSVAATLQAVQVSGDFSVGNSTCGTTLAAAAGCSFAVTFSPSASGLRTGVVTLRDNGGTHSVPVSGTGLAGQVTLTPTSLTFPDTPPGQLSAVRTILLLNSGNGPLAIGSVTISGDFLEADSCANRTLPAGQSCSLNVHFQPAGGGPRTGTLVIGTDAGGSAGVGTGNSTSVVPLSGSGQSSFSIVLSPSALSFGSVAVNTTSSVQNITISNTGTGSGPVGAVQITGDYVVKANTCGSSLGTQTGCTVSVAFVPTASGTRTGMFSITDGAGVQTATLSGVGSNPATDTLSTASLGFAATTVNSASAAQTVTLTNSGDAALTLVSAKVTAGDFSVVNGCGPALAPHTSCGISVTFAPKSVGALTGTLEIDDVLRAEIVSLAGTASAPAGVVSFSPLSLNFPSTGVGNATAPQTVTLTNNGTAALPWGSITVSGDFGLTPPRPRPPAARARPVCLPARAALCQWLLRRGRREPDTAR